MPLNDNICSRILTPKQVGPICWFMATFVAMFYSQRSRKILLEASKGWDVKKKGFTIFTDKRVKLFKLLKHILDDKFLKVESRESNDYKKFSDNTFGNVLTLLNKVNNKLFPYIPSKVLGFNAEYYIGKLYEFLNVDYVMFDYNVLDDFLTFSYLNEEFDDNIIYKIVKKKIIISITPNRTFKYIEENIKPPPILMVIISDNKEYTQFYKKVFPNNTIKEGATKNELKSMREQIFFKGVEYNLDSVILSNWNINKYNGHSIAGITCKKDKYIYNGWTRTSMDPVMLNKNITRKIPCELMKYDWNIKNNGDFCLNTAKCIPDVLRNKLGKKDICFNFSKGRRVLVYVRKDANSNTSNENDANDAKSIDKGFISMEAWEIEYARIIKVKGMKQRKVNVKGGPFNNVAYPQNITNDSILAKQRDKQLNPPPIDGFRIVNTFKHTKESFCQGISWCPKEKVMFEGSGGFSGGHGARIAKIDLETGKTLMYCELPVRFFGEGIVIIGDRLYQLTWKSREGFVYDKTSLKLIDNFYYDHQGWGATTDGVAIIISDGSQYLYFYNPNTFELQKKLLVEFLGSKSGKMMPLRRLNDLQYINGKIWANIWKSNLVAVINPSSGFVERFVDFKNLLDTNDEWIKKFMRKKDRCLNGIAFDQEKQRIFVTGKMWTKIYEIKVIEGKVDRQIDAKSPKKCPEGKVLNPKTGRCILIKNKNLLVIKPPVKSPKKCPEGKVLNPKTGRCILIKNKNLLVIKPPVKSPKKCPEGKVLNPKTGRCILIKNNLKKK